MSRAILSWLAERPRHRLGVRVLQGCLGAAYLFRAATELPFASWLHGPHGVGRGSTAPLLGEALGALADVAFTFAATPYFLLVLQAVGALLLLAGVRTRVGALLCLLGVWGLELRTPEILDGGDNLARLMLLYMLVLVPADAPEPPVRSLRTWVHNLGVVVMAGQVLMLYYTAGMAKASGSVWINGTALYVVSRVDEFSLPALRWLFSFPVVTVGASYATMVWQVLFPVAIFSRLRLPFVIVGCLFHLGVALFMGLVTFSTIMVGAELLLLSDAELGSVRAAFGRGLAVLGRRWTSRRASTSLREAACSSDLSGSSPE